MSPALVVFDVDGTLIDSRAMILAAMRAAFRARGLEAPDEAETLAIVGLSLPVAVRRLRPDLPEAEADRIAACYRAAFREIRAETGGEAAAPLYPGTRAMLARLAARPELRLGIATGKSRQGLAHMLAAHGLGDVFATTQTADLHASKPDPAMLAAALAETGIGPERAVMVGDTEFDIAMGRAAGTATIGVAWGYHPVTRLEAAGAGRILRHFDALDGALAELGIAA